MCLTNITCVCLNGVYLCIEIMVFFIKVSLGTIIYKIKCTHFHIEIRKHRTLTLNLFHDTTLLILILYSFCYK